MCSSALLEVKGEGWINVFLCVVYVHRSDPACVEILSVSLSSSSGLLLSPYYPSQGADEVLSDTAINSRLYTSQSSEVDGSEGDTPLIRTP